MLASPLVGQYSPFTPDWCWNHGEMGGGHVFLSFCECARLSAENQSQHSRYLAGLAFPLTSTVASCNFKDSSMTRDPLVASVSTGSVLTTQLYRVTPGWTYTD